MLTNVEDILFYLLTIAIIPYLIGKMILEVKSGVFEDIHARRLYCIGCFGLCSSILTLIHMIYCFNFSVITGRMVFLEWGWMALACPLSLYLGLKGKSINAVQLATKQGLPLPKEYHSWKLKMKIMLWIETVMIVVVSINILGAILGGEQSPIVHNWNKVICSLSVR